MVIFWLVPTQMGILLVKMTTSMSEKPSCMVNFIAFGPNLIRKMGVIEQIFPNASYIMFETT